MAARRAPKRLAGRRARGRAAARAPCARSRRPASTPPSGSSASTRCRCSRCRWCRSISSACRCGRRSTRRCSTSRPTGCHAGVDHVVDLHAGAGADRVHERLPDQGAPHARLRAGRERPLSRAQADAPPATPAVVQEFRRRYNEVVRGCPFNHARVDYLMARPSATCPGPTRPGRGCATSCDVYALYGFCLHRAAAGAAAVPVESERRRVEHRSLRPSVRAGHSSPGRVHE